MKKKSLFLFCILLIGTALCTLANAEPPSTHIDDIFITATRFEKSTTLIPHAITTVTQEEIQAMNAQQVTDILYQLPSIHALPLGAQGDDFDIYMRGTDRDETIIYLDGIKLNNASNDRARLNSIPTHLIDRIEIIRGSQSVLYGSKAIGGIIQIFTKNEKEKQTFTDIQFSGGNLDTLSENILFHHSDQRIAIDLAYSRTDQKGRFSQDRFGKNAFSAKLSITLPDQSILRTSSHLWQHNQELFYEYLVAPGIAVDNQANPNALFIFVDRDTNRHMNSLSTAHSLYYNRDHTAWWQTTFQYDFLYTKENDHNSNQGDTGPTTNAGFTLIPSSFLNTIRSYRHHALIQNNFTILDNARMRDIIISGIDFEYDDVKISGTTFPGDNAIPAGSIGPLPANTDFPIAGEPGNRKNYAFFLENDFTYNHWLTVNTGIRVDHNSSFGTEFTPRIALSAKIKHTDTLFKASYGHGFHAPTVTDFYIAKAFGLNNQLKPEHSQAYELGCVQYLLKKTLMSEINLFYIDYDNLIASSQNTNDAYSMGIESIISWKPIPEIAITANYSYTKAIDESNNNTPLPNRPKHQGTISITGKPITYMILRADLSYTGKQFESFAIVDANGIPISGSFANASIASNRHISDYVILNASTSYDFAHHLPGNYFDKLNVFAKLMNITNQKHQSRYGFPSAGITFLAGMGARF